MLTPMTGCIDGVGLYQLVSRVVARSPCTSVVQESGKEHKIRGTAFQAVMPLSLILFCVIR